MVTMDSMPTNPILEYNRIVKEYVRKKFDLDKPGRLEEAVEILDKWVKEQEHFKNKNFDYRYLVNTIIGSKGSLERAKRRTDRMCSLRTLLPQYFGEYNLREDFKETQIGVTFAFLPKQTPDHNRVLLVTVSGEKWYSSLMLHVSRLFVIYGEYLKLHECANGYVMILDFREGNIMEAAKHINLVDLRNGVTITTEGIGVSVKGIHFITSSKAIEVIVNILKSVLSNKLGSRIQVHTSLDALYETVPKEILPAEYGGKENTLLELQEKWTQVLESKENKEYLRIMNASGTDESLRDKDKYNEECMGMPGTFRTLTVD